MARIVGGICTSHIPAIGNAIARGLEGDDYWQPIFAGYPRAREWLADVKPDVAVMIYNDHGLNFFLDKMPTFAIGAATEYRNADEGWGLPTVAPFPGDPKLSWHIIESVMADEFDVTTCQEMLVDHAFTVPLALLWPGRNRREVRTVPVALNTVQHPLPSPARCFKLGRALGRAIESYEEDLRVVVIGTGGMSHQLDGERAGFINREFDLRCLDSIVDDPAALTRYTIHDLVGLAGTQGVELISWLVMRGALSSRVRKVHSHYHVPVSNTAAGLLVLANAA
jgi:protocatechuate 4,5-dioxygenase beta chain